MPLPDQQFVGEEEREELKEWVLTLSMDVDVQPELATDERGAFVGSLLDSKTGERARACIVSGYPVLSQPVEMKDHKVCRYLSPLVLPLFDPRSLPEPPFFWPPAPHHFTPIASQPSIALQAAGRESWNKFVMAVKSAHREELNDVLRFLTQWCGAPQNPSYSFN